MSKLIKSMIYILSICVVLLGCSDGVNKKAAEIKNEENKVISSEGTDNKSNESNESNKEQEEVVSEETENANNSLENNANNQSKKQVYLDKLGELEVQLNISLKEKYDSGVTNQMVEAASEEYYAWDNMLNEIYSELKVQLTEEEMNKLTEEELNWINSRDEKSLAADDGFEDGSIAPLYRVMSLVTSTKERCYELVNKYMK